MSNQQTPWLDAQGKIKPDSDLREECHTWGPEVWERYLKNFEVAQNELLAPNIAQLSDDRNQVYIEVYKSLLTQDDFPLLKKVINAALCALTKQEQQALRYLYWEGMNNSEAAESMGIGRKTLTTYRDRALKKLTNFLLHGALERGVAFLAETKGGQPCLRTGQNSHR